MSDTLRVRSGFAALVLLGLAAAAGLGYLAVNPDWQPTPPTPFAIANAGIPLPAFDLVRVDPTGHAVIAGTAAPGATITIERGDRLLGTTTADAAGAFVLLPNIALPAGPQQLTLAETLGNGTTIQGQTSATLLVPAQLAGPALTVISGPGGSQVLSADAPPPGTLAIGTVDYDAAGHAIVSGTAPPGTRIALALDGARLGAATAAKDGRWRCTATMPATSGTLRLTTADAAQPALTAPFALQTWPAALAGGQVVIAPGRNLWLIAREANGHGNLYTLIYNAITPASHDPDLIVPGQAFALPKQKATH